MLLCRTVEVCGVYKMLLHLQKVKVEGEGLVWREVGMVQSKVVGTMIGMMMGREGTA